MIPSIGQVDYSCAGTLQELLHKLISVPWSIEYNTSQCLKDLLSLERLDLQERAISVMLFTLTSFLCKRFMLNFVTLASSFSTNGHRIGILALFQSVTRRVLMQCFFSHQFGDSGICPNYGNLRSPLCFQQVFNVKIEVHVLLHTVQFKTWILFYCRHCPERKRGCPSTQFSS